MGSSTEEELAILQRNTVIDMFSDDFRANWQLLDAWEVKPQSEFMTGQENISLYAVRKSMSEWNVCLLCVLLPSRAPFTLRLLEGRSERL
jgi:hypothetical protein